MSKVILTPNITADGSFLLTTVYKNRTYNMYYGTIIAAGTFGGGTLTFTVSPDGGATKVPMKDITGNVTSLTAGGMANVPFGVGSRIDDGIQVFATMTGSTTPSVTVSIFSNEN